MKPAIGISTSLLAGHADDFGGVALTFAHGKLAYSDCILAAGGLPFFLPTLAPERAGELLDRLDGLLLSGGNDLDPGHYGQTNVFADSVIHPVRDAWELALALAARERGIPVFGICRGHQLLNVAFGGSLFQDLSLRPGTAEHRALSETQPRLHAVSILPGTEMARFLGETAVQVTSTHHQVLDRIAPGFRVAARADDGVAEALEYAADPLWIRSVQWHPEITPDAPSSRALFTDFVRRACETRRASSPSGSTKFTGSPRT